MNSNQQKIQIFNDLDLNQERNNIRTKKGKQPLSKEEVLQEFSILNNISEINQMKMKHINDFIKEHSQQHEFIEKFFPFQLYFQILIEDSFDARVKVFALKILSFFSQFSTFPFDELINSSCFSYLFDTFKQSNSEFILSPILNILTYLLKTHPECRDSLIEEEILNAVSEKLISPKIPAFLETILTITPSLPPEGISQINFLYECLLKKYLQINYNNRFEVNLIQNTIYSIIHLLKLQFSPFDFSFVMNYIDPLLDSSERKIVLLTVRMIGFIPFPTIQYLEKCSSKVISFVDLEIIHTLLKVFIRKHDEWENSEDIVIETCLIIVNQDNSISEPSFNDKLLCLKVLLLYYHFNQYDKRVLDLLIEFINFSDISMECIQKLIMMFETADFDGDEKAEFISTIESSIDEFQTALEEDNDEDFTELISYFLQEVEQEAK